MPAPPLPAPRPAVADSRLVVVPVVHAVTTPELVADAGFPARARAVMRALGARGAVHLRAPGLTARQLLEVALALGDAQRETGCWLVVNDRVDVALAAGVRGVQLTTRSMSPADARRIAPGLALGASVHDAAAAARAAAEGADWVVAGHVYATASHPGEAPGGEALVRDVAATARLPVIAIGGVRPEHVPALRRAGAHGVAVIRGVWAASDADRAATDYLASYDADATGDGDDRPDGERRAP
ncbi:MAG TPA: thiamine phosphate synthase [Gemmatimonadaceae bacterium]|nr:thiamine phosphate synthase [Gemmatimonadaceae bacterium]